jgi:tRNA pseudouridine38-40 synthase
VREILASAWRAGEGGWLNFTITATGFLRGMVRSLVGTMVEVGRSKAPPERLAELLASHARHLAGPTAPPQGLYLVEVFHQ